ncbi:hypothetical protein IBX38_08315 [Candidatus Bathyarchaeota archaeon]|nr:hypothetical protein [Candidatus Bathyarchaeota archaeon]
MNRVKLTSSSTVTVKVPKDVVEALKLLERSKPIGEALKGLMVHEVERRICRYKLMAKVFESKYKMSFREFDEQDAVEKLGHTWDVERDYFDWELATTELESLEKILRRLASS